MKIFLLIAVFLALPTLALAADADTSRPHWTLDLKGGVLFPSVSGWSTFYGQSYTEEFGAGFGYKPLRQLEVGVDADYIRAEGKGQAPLHHAPSTEGVTLELLPVDVYLLVRGVFDEKQWLVPYLGGGYTRMFYRESMSGLGDVKGSVNGYHAKAGLQFLLDRLEPGPAQSLYSGYGIFHTYFFVEGKYRHATAPTNDSGSVNLGGTSALAGLMVEF